MPRAPSTLFVIALFALPLATAGPPAAWAEDGPSGPSVLPRPHPPISIDGDAGFHDPRAGVRGGAGTPEDPFLIEDWVILGSFQVGIALRDTRASVVIRNVVIISETPEGEYRAACRVADPGCEGTAGIRLTNATHVTIESVQVQRVGRAIDLDRSGDVRARGVSIASTVVGVKADDAWGLTLSDVRIRKTTFPLEFERVDDALLARVDAEAGIASSVLDSRGVTFREGRFAFGGIYLVGANEALDVGGTLFFRGSVGISHLQFPGDVLRTAVVCDNAFERVLGGNNNVYLPPSTGLVLRGNTFRNGTGALWLVEPEGAKVERNHIEATPNGSFSVAVGAGAANRFRDNTLLSPTTAVFAPGTDARSNWWGAADGPGGALGGGGTPVLAPEGVQFAPWLTAPPDLEGPSCPTKLLPPEVAVPEAICIAISTGGAPGAQRPCVASG